MQQEDGSRPIRILCPSLDDFAQNLREALGKGHGIFENMVWASVTRKSINESKKEVNFLASCVIQLQESEYILEFVQPCGFDYDDGSGEREGSIAALELKDKVVALAEECGLQVLPGIIGE